MVMWRHLARPVGKGHRHLVSFARWVSGIVGDQGQTVMQTGLGVVGDQGANVVGAVSKTNMACKMGGVGRGQGQHVMNAHCVFFARTTRAAYEWW